MTLWDADDSPTTPTGTFGAADSDPPEVTWTVAELGEAIRLALTTRFQGTVWVSGEIRNLRPPNANGHRYFDLVEAPSEPGARATATIAVALFDRVRQRVNAKLREAGGGTRMSDGVQIRIRAKVDWWVAAGKLQLVMEDIDPVFTLGVLEAERAKLLAQLRDEGLVDLNSRQPLSPLPLRIALVTSRGSAAHADTLHELESSRYRFTVLTLDARVQGRDAPASIERALRAVGSLAVDAVLLVRGGGARTDLVAFDSEMVARAIATCTVPVFCGIGHEIDRSVADDVAHTSAKTPTACAAAIVAHVRLAENALDARLGRTVRQIEAALVRANASLHEAARRADNATGRSLREAQRLHAGNVRRVAFAARTSVNSSRVAADDRARRLQASARQRLTDAALTIENAERQVHLADPARLLARGWSITRTASGDSVRDPSAAPPGTTLVTTVAGGSIASTVVDHRPSSHDPEPEMT